METRSIFQNISPLDHRYSKSEASLYKKLSSHLSEDAVSTSLAKAEIALLKAHLFMQGKLNKESKEYLDKIDFSSLSEEIYEEEEKTQHNIRALVNVLKRKVPEKLVEKLL